MIKVITERHIKKGEEEKYVQLLRDAHPIAKQQPGYIVTDPCVSMEDPSVFLVAGNWEKLEDWQAWVNSEEGHKLYELIAPLLTGESKSTFYNIIPLYET